MVVVKPKTIRIHTWYGIQKQQKVTWWYLTMQAKGLLSEYQPKYNSARAVYRERKKYVDEIDWNMLAVPPSGSYKAIPFCFCFISIVSFARSTFSCLCHSNWLYLSLVIVLEGWLFKSVVCCLQHIGQCEIVNRSVFPILLYFFLFL